MYKLVDSKTNEEVKVGDVRTSHRGEQVIVTGYKEPQHKGSTGRVFCKMHSNVDRGNSEQFTIEWFPGVIGCKIVEE